MAPPRSANFRISSVRNHALNYILANERPAICLPHNQFPFRSVRLTTGLPIFAVTPVSHYFSSPRSLIPSLFISWANLFFLFSFFLVFYFCYSFCTAARFLALYFRFRCRRTGIARPLEHCECQSVRYKSPATLGPGQTPSTKHEEQNSPARMLRSPKDLVPYKRRFVCETSVA